MSYNFNFLSILTIIHSSFILVLLLYSLYYRPKTVQFRIYTMLTFIALILSVANIFVFSAPNPEAVWFWHYITINSWILIVSFAILFILCIERETGLPPWWQIILVFIIPPAFVFRSLTGKFMVEKFAPGPYGMYEIHVDGSLWYNLWIAYIIVCVFANYFISAKKLALADSKRIRRQMLIYITGVTFPIIFSVLFQIIIPKFKIAKFPAIGHFFTLPYLLLLLYAQVRYRFMAIDIHISADMVVEKINSAVILFNKRGDLVSINRSGMEILGYDHSCSDRCHFNRLFLEKEKINRLMADPDGNGNYNLDLDTSLLANDDTAIPMHVSIITVFDEFNDHTGYIVTGNVIDILSSAQERYCITEREKTVLVNLLLGSDYDQIAESLNISYSTVKNHIHNIYQKTGARNRSELMKVCFVKTKSA